MLTFLSTYWIWILLIGGMLFMHRGHGGHGGANAGGCGGGHAGTEHTATRGHTGHEHTAERPASDHVSLEKPPIA